MTRYRRAAVLFHVFLSSIVFAQVNPLQRGVQLFREENYVAALEQFQEAREAHPTDASISNFIGIIETKLGRIEDANADYEKAIRLDPALPGPRKNLGFNYLNAGQYERAEEQLKAALALDGSDAFPHYYLAILYLATSRDQEAILQIEPAGSLLENDPIAAFSMAKACFGSNAPAQGLKMIESLERHSSLSVAQEYELANLLNQKHMYAESAERFERAIEMQPAAWENKYNYALALLNAKQTTQAIPLLQHLTADRPKDATILSLLGSAYDAADNLPAALETYRKAIAADPQNPDRYLDCTQLLMDIDRYDDAIQVVQQGLQNVQDPYPLNIRLGAIEMMKGEFGKAREAFLAAIDKHPEIVMGHVALAQTYMKEGNNAEALTILADTRQKLPRDFVLEYAFGLLSAGQGNRDQAFQAFKNAEQMEPSVVEPHYQLGALYMEIQDWSRAKEELEQAVQLDPQRAAAYYQLSRTYARMGDLEKARETGEEASRLTQSQREESIKKQKTRLAEASPR
jgi:tetratricopeptide (TPR) repeat protein